MKDTLIVLCSPNISHLNARRALGSIKSTDLGRAELIIIDNQYDHTFCHTEIMNRMLNYAAKVGKNIIFVDDDVEIYRYDWIDRLYEVSKKLGADIAGCVHTYDDGEINHEGYYVDNDGTVEQISDYMHHSFDSDPYAVYVPSLCSAVMLVKNCGSFSFDEKFKKYQQDLDICLEAWRSGKKVACALDVRIMHHRGYTGESNPAFQDIFSNDSDYFAGKWAWYVPQLYDIPQLSKYSSFTPVDSWTRYYNKASRLKNVNKEKSHLMFMDVVKRCPNEKRVSGAYYHLYSMDGEVSHLYNCLELNPCHGGAREKLEALVGTGHYTCKVALDCRMCHLKAKRKMYTLRTE